MCGLHHAALSLSLPLKLIYFNSILLIFKYNFGEISLIILFFYLKLMDHEETYYYYYYNFL